jgi:sugar-phosphatase
MIGIPAPAESIEAVIFDMDGVLIDSEPFWQEAEITAFERVGLGLTRAMCRETMGLRVDEVVAHWRRRHGWASDLSGELEEAIISGVVERILREGEAKEGVGHALAFFEGRGVRVALASSSAYRLIGAVLDRLGLAGAFELVYSAEEEPYGKPHPGVYLTTAAKLGVPPAASLAIEDSFNGVLAAKAARMRCLAVPEPAMRHDPRFVIADTILGSLADLDAETWRLLNE